MGRHSCLECFVHDELLGTSRESGSRKLWYQGGLDDHRTRHDSNPADSGWTKSWWQRLAWRTLRISEHHPIGHGCCESSWQVLASIERQVDRHGFPCSNSRCVSGGFDMSLG